jgi:hypothetical protein
VVRLSKATARERPLQQSPCYKHEAYGMPVAMRHCSWPYNNACPERLEEPTLRAAPRFACKCPRWRSALPFLAVPVAEYHASRLLEEAFRRYAKSSDMMRRTFSCTACVPAAWQECGRLFLVYASHADHSRDWLELWRGRYLTVCAQCLRSRHSCR